VTASPTVFDTSAGRVEIEFGINNWVLVSIRSGRDQEQLDSPKKLRDYLSRRGLPDREADDVAKAAWKARPGDAAISSASADEGLVASTGLSGSGLLVALTAFVMLWVVVLVYAITHWPR
jgi:hypothetical protein